MRDFKTLIVWKKSHELTLQVYQATQNFPREELYGLTSQVRRASASIPANIAEGCGRNTNAELAQFLQIAMGSASELEYHLILAYDLKFIPSEEYQALNIQVVEVKKILFSFIQKLRGRE